MNDFPAIAESSYRRARTARRRRRRGPSTAGLLFQWITGAVVGGAVGWFIVAHVAGLHPGRDAGEPNPAGDVAAPRGPEPRPVKPAKLVRRPLAVRFGR